MKKFDLGQTMNTLANIGVIAGIAFLAVEISQNNQALEAQARLQREAVLRNSWERRITNPELARATVKARANEPLTAEERFLLNELNRAVITDGFFIFQQVQDGLLSPTAIMPILWRESFHENFALMPETWAAHKSSFPQQFIQWYDENIVLPGPPD